MNIIERTLLKLFPHFDILDEATGSLYLRRFYVWPRRSRADADRSRPRWVIHKFYRGDKEDALHDHPWPFTTFVVAGGYWEHQPAPDYLRYLQSMDNREAEEQELRDFQRQPLTWLTPEEENRYLFLINSNRRREVGCPVKTVRVWIHPGMLLRRRAKWRHRVELPPGKTAWTILRLGAKENDWGFFTNRGFCAAKAYLEGRCDG